MITINLLPAELRPVKRTPVPYMASLLLAVVATLACLKMYTENTSKISELVERQQRNEQELASLKDSVDKYNQLSEEKSLLANQLNTIKEIASDRIIWSEQLYHLTRLALPNMWYDKIDVKSQTTSIKREVVDPVSKKPKTITDKITTRILVLEGYVASDATGRTFLNRFTTATVDDPEFSSMFQLDKFDSSDTEFEGAVVKKFTLEYSISTGGATE